MINNENNYSYEDFFKDFEEKVMTYFGDFFEFKNSDAYAFFYFNDCYCLDDKMLGVMKHIYSVDKIIQSKISKRSWTI